LAPRPGFFFGEIAPKATQKNWQQPPQRKTIKTNQDFHQIEIFLKVTS
jgi:hypothetical protein